jgi:hypothetical protein
MLIEIVEENWTLEPMLDSVKSDGAVAIAASQWPVLVFLSSSSPFSGTSFSAASFSTASFSVSSFPAAFFLAASFSAASLAASFSPLVSPII